MNLPARFKPILLIIGIVILLNLLGWLLFGKNHTIQMVGTQSEYHTAHYSQQSDSISIFNNPRGDELPWHYQLYSDFSTNEQENLKLVVSEHYGPIKVVEEMGNTSYQNQYFDFFIISGFPLFAKVTTRVFRGPGTTVYEGIYIYFFGWHEISSRLRGIS